MTTAYLGLGSNIGERISFIDMALKEISRIDKTEIVKSSAIYETEPWGVKEQGKFLNSVIEVSTDLSAQELLNALKDIEKKAGRTVNSKWSEREIDIDLLFYGNEEIQNEHIHVPHAEIEKRKFVLIPMMELSPDLIHPGFKKTIKELLSETEDSLEVKTYRFATSEN